MKESTVYLDHNATTPPAPEVVEAMLPFLAEQYGNASSPHGRGRVAREAVEAARRRVAGWLGCEPSEVVWTSGGTEANTMAIRSALAVTGKRHIVTSGVEHHAVSEVIDQCQREGCAVTRVPVDEEGRLDPADVEAAIGPETALVAVMWANNETGVRLPVEAVGEVCRRSRVLFHVDGVQAAGKIPIRLADLAVDSVAFSAHKFYGPKGVGALYLRRRSPFLPLMPGGGQERGRRGGTENVPAIVGMGRAAELAEGGLAAYIETTGALRDRLEAGLKERLPSVRVNGEGAERLSNTCNVTFPGVDGEALLLRLDQEGIAVSTGSACATGAMEPSHVLLAMGRKRREALSSIRISLGKNTTAAEIDRALDVIATAAQALALE